MKEGKVEGLKGGGKNEKRGTQESEPLLVYRRKEGTKEEGGKERRNEGRHKGRKTQRKEGIKEERNNGRKG